MSEWREIRLGDLCYRVCSGGTPKSTCSSYYEGGKIPWLNTKEINYNRIFTTESHITEEGMNNSSAKWIDANSVIVAMYGATAGRVAVAKVPMTTNQACCNLMIDKSKADYNFIFYYLSNSYKHLLSMANGAAQQNLNAQVIKDYMISLPDIHEQHSIASILSSFDDKIAINRRICENLEAQAQALFKHWFIDFAPFKDGKFIDSELGKIPEGWRVQSLGEICKCELGGTPSRANKSYWGGNIPWINSGEVNKFRICEASEHITEEGLNHSATKLLPTKTTVLAITGATLGQVSLLEIDSCANQSVVGVKENQNIPYTFIYPAIKSKIKELVNMQTGGAQQHINKDNIQSLKIALSPHIYMKEYKSITLPLYEEIGKLCFENLRLASLRDTLLPCLMSGELKINDVEKNL
jgi:type I restriction enzyme S subunit